MLFCVLICLGDGELFSVVVTELLLDCWAFRFILLVCFVFRFVCWGWGGMFSCLFFGFVGVALNSLVYFMLYFFGIFVLVWLYVDFLRYGHLCFFICAITGVFLLYRLVSVSEICIVLRVDFLI